MRPFHLASPALAVAAACTFEQARDFPPDEVITVEICGVAEDSPVDGEVARDDGDTPCPELDGFAADGVDLAMLVIDFPSGSAAGKDVVLTTNRGILDPTADGAGKFTKTLKTPNAGPLIAYLHAGVDSGPAVVRATLGGVYNEAQVELTPAAPDEIDIVASVYVMALGGATGTDLNIYLHDTSAPKATVSAGLDVHLQVCSAAGKIADVQRLVRTAAPNTGLVAAKIALNALGAAILDEVAEPNKPSETLKMYAYIPGEEQEPIAEDASCDDLAAGIGSAIAHDHVDLILLRKPM